MNLPCGQKPVGITALGSEYSILITCCYMAKRAGIKRGMRVKEAREACPDIAIRVARPDVYVDIHNKIVAEVHSHVPVKKVWSIDEVECELIAASAKMPMISPSPFKTVCAAISGLM